MRGHGGAGVLGGQSGAELCGLCSRGYILSFDSNNYVLADM